MQLQVVLYAAPQHVMYDHVCQHRTGINEVQIG